MFAPALPALPSLTSPSALVLAWGTWFWEGAQAPQPLDVRPGPLRELILNFSGKAHALPTIPRLGGVTKLRLSG